MILCVWQTGADSLVEEYRHLEKTLPKADNLETMVMNKQEIIRKFKVNDYAGESTAHQINAVCKNISQFLPGKEIHLFIDECWISVPTKFEAHMTNVSPTILACAQNVKQIKKISASQYFNFQYFQYFL